MPFLGQFMPGIWIFRYLVPAPNKWLWLRGWRIGLDYNRKTDWQSNKSQLVTRVGIRVGIQVRVPNNKVTHLLSKNVCDRFVPASGANPNPNPRVNSCPDSNPNSNPNSGSCRPHQKVKPNMANMENFLDVSVSPRAFSVWRWSTAQRPETDVQKDFNSDNLQLHCLVQLPAEVNLLVIIMFEQWLIQTSVSILLIIDKFEKQNFESRY